MINHETKGNIIRTWTDLPDTILLQVETGIRYGSEVWDAVPLRYTYQESPMTPEELESKRRAEEMERRYGDNI